MVGDRQTARLCWIAGGDATQNDGEMVTAALTSLCGGRNGDGGGFTLASGGRGARGRGRRDSDGTRDRDGSEDDDAHKDGDDATAVVAKTEDPVAVIPDLASVLDRCPTLDSPRTVALGEAVSVVQ